MTKLTDLQRALDELAESTAETHRRLDAVELELCALAAQVTLWEIRQTVARRAPREADQARAAQLARWHADDHHRAEPDPDPHPVPHAVQHTVPHGAQHSVRPVGQHAGPGPEEGGR